MSRKPKSKAPLVVIGLCLCAVGALTAYVATGPGRTVPDDLKKPEAGRPATKTPEQTQVSVLKPKFDKGDLKFEASKQDVPKGEDPMVASVNAYLKGVPAVPKDAQLLSASVENGTAMLNFNAAFAGGYGTEDEQAIVNGVLASLAQFPGVSRAQFLVDGKPLDSLGNIDLSTPQAVLKEGGLTESDRDIKAPE